MSAGLRPDTGRAGRPLGPRAGPRPRATAAGTVPSRPARQPGPGVPDPGRRPQCAGAGSPRAVHRGRFAGGRFTGTGSPGRVRGSGPAGSEPSAPVSRSRAARARPPVRLPGRSRTTGGGPAGASPMRRPGRCLARCLAGAVAGPASGSAAAAVGAGRRAAPNRWRRDGARRPRPVGPRGHGTGAAAPGRTRGRGAGGPRDRPAPARVSRSPCRSSRSRPSMRRRAWCPAAPCC